MRLIAILLILGVTSTAIGDTKTENWPAWRGPRGDGTSLEVDLPTRWDGARGENVVWKTPLPGTGHSSPITWNDAVFVTACDEKDGARLLIRLDGSTGRVVWRRTILTAPLEKRHQLNSYASGTPTTDGSQIYVSFLEPDFASQSERTPGDLVVAAYDFGGNLKWMVKPGRFASVHGFCSSPLLYKDKVIVNGDHDGDGYIAALSRDAGQTLWRIARPNNTRSYVTPIIREIAGRTQMVLSGSKCVASYDPDTGEQIWYMAGPTEQFVASLVFNGDLLFLTAGFPEKHVLAIRADGTGTLSDDSIVWRTTRNCSYVPSPVLCGPYLLVVADNGVATCYEASTGKLQWTKRLDTMNHSASLITAAGLVFFLADDGVMRIVRPGPEFELVGENALGEDCFASPAVSNGRIYLRSRSHLYCIDE